MNYIDFIIVFFLVSFAVIGYFRGALREMSDILITGISFLVAAVSFQTVSLYVHLPSIFPQSYDRSASFFIVWFFIEVLLYLFVLFAMNSLPLLITESKLVTYLGPTVALVKGILTLVIIFALLTLLPLGKEFERGFGDSLLVGLMNAPTRGVASWFTQSFSEESKSAVFVSGEGSISRIDLGSKFAHPSSDSASATKLGQIVNDSRVLSSLDKLTVDTKLSAVALEHARDLAAAGYLSQVSSDGKTLINRLSSFDDITYLGENSALGGSVDVIRTGMMANTADSANVLSETFTRFGVGVVDLGAHGKLAVLEFAG